MTDPVNLNIPGFDYLFFALLFFGVVGFFTLLLAWAELTLQRKRRARMTVRSTLLESRRVEGRLEWIAVKGQDAADQARARRTYQRRQADPSELIQDAEG